MRYGTFDQINKEYVIEKPNTPLPWINYLGSSNYCALLSNTAGGYSFFVDPRENRITRYRYDNVPFDQGGRYIYIRDKNSGQYWSPTWQPVRKKLDKYECRHGLGYSTIESEYDGIKTKITYFVPLDENQEIWKLEITALAGKSGKKVRSLDLFSYIEFCLWDTVGDTTNFQRTWSIGQAHAEESTIYHTTMFGNWKDLFAYFHCSEPLAGFDTQRRDFLGDWGYNNLDKPEVVVKGQSKNSLACGWAPIGSHHVEIDLKPGQTKTIVFVLGVSKNKTDAKKAVAKAVAGADKALAKLKDSWEEKLSRFQCETPDHEMNLSLNIWNQYQCITTFNWSRYASYYEAGVGRGMGFRDSNQDTLGFGHMLPEKVRERILELAAIQFEDGSTYHQYSPITKKGALLGYSDDALWMVLSTAHYIKETGDKKILKAGVNFAPKRDWEPATIGHHTFGVEHLIKEPKVKITAGTLYEHLKRGMNRVYSDQGSRGLPLSKFADWNDCLNMLGKNHDAQSVMVAQMLVAASREMIALAPLAKAAGAISETELKKEIKLYEKIITEMTKKVNTVAWDGAWYMRAFDDSGKPVGSKACSEGKIFLETQAWAVLSGVADRKNATTSLDSADKHLFTPYGLVLLQPAYRHYQPQLGEISTYPPGLKENAAVFCHVNPWVIIAECMLGRADKAYKFYRAILPEAQNEIAEIRKTEPYVYCQMAAGKDHVDAGECKNSWLTGSASWNFIAGAEYILGVRPEYSGLIIDPCIPKKWNGFTVTRVYRGCTYIIAVKNPSHVSKGVSKITLDKVPLDTNLVPAQNDGKTHRVEVVMG